MADESTILHISHPHYIHLLSVKNLPPCCPDVHADVRGHAAEEDSSVPHPPDCSAQNQQETGGGDVTQSSTLGENGIQ